MREDIKKYLDELKTNLMVKGNDNHFLSVETYSCILNNGRTIKREKILKNKKNGSAAIVFPITEESKIIMAIEPRVFTKTTVAIDLPAGYIEDGEYPYFAAKRELKEETGYDSENLIYIGSYYQDQGISGAYNYYFVALNCKKVCEQHLDKDEFIKYILVDMQELNELLELGYILGLNSAYLIEKGKEYVKRR